LQAAIRQGAPGGVLPASVTLSLFGHIHIWEVVDFVAGRAPVRVAGNGGTSESLVTDPAAGALVDGVAIQGFWKTLGMGYTVMESTGTGWRATLRPVSTTCTVNGGRLVL